MCCYLNVHFQGQNVNSVWICVISYVFQNKATYINFSLISYVGLEGAPPLCPNCVLRSGVAVNQ